VLENEAEERSGIFAFNVLFRGRKYDDTLILPGRLNLAGNFRVTKIVLRCTVSKTSKNNCDVWM